MTAPTPRPYAHTVETQRHRINLALRDHQIPEHMHGGVLRYLTDGIAPGDFLLSILKNDMLAAQAQADTRNAEAFARWQTFMLQEMPSNCWGGPRMVADWIAHKGLSGKATP